MVITDENQRLIDILIGHCPDEETLLSDTITMLLAKRLTHVPIKSFQYVIILLRVNTAFIFNTFRKTRCSVLAPFAARYLDNDITIREFTIPSGTPIIHALGVSLHNNEVFPNPDIFDPERFNPGKSKT